MDPQVRTTVKEEVDRVGKELQEAVNREINKIPKR